MASPNLQLLWTKTVGIFLVPFSPPSLSIFRTDLSSPCRQFWKHLSTCWSALKGWPPPPPPRTLIFPVLPLPKPCSPSMCVYVFSKASHLSPEGACPPCIPFLLCSGSKTNMFGSCLRFWRRWENGMSKNRTCTVSQMSLLFPQHIVHRSNLVCG